MEAFVFVFGVVVLLITAPRFVDDVFVVSYSPFHFVKVGRESLKRWKRIIRDVGVILFIAITFYIYLSVTTVVINE